jgi:dTMP kinase
VVVEGIDGAGKTTAVRRIVDAIDDTDRPVLATHEPTDTFVGKAVRQAIADPDHDPASEALLFAADHAAHVRRLSSHLAEGALVVSDRYSTSWRVYQALTLEDTWPDDADTSPSAWLDRVIDPVERDPDLVLVLDLPADTALDRLDERPGEDEKFERRRFLERVREAYQTFAEDDNARLIDAARSADAIADDCIEHVRALTEGRP